MKTIIAVAALFATLAIAGQPTYKTEADVCSGAPPAVSAATSPDGSVCLGQAVRDSHGTVWTFTAAACPGYGSPGHCLIPNSGPKTTANKVRIQGGVVSHQESYSPQWIYYEYSIGGFLYVGSKVPTPTPAPPGAPKGQ